MLFRPNRCQLTNKGSLIALSISKNEKEKEMETITLSTPLVNAILGYLGKRPYEETFQLIDALQKEAKASIDNQQETKTE